MTTQDDVPSLPESWRERQSPRMTLLTDTEFYAMERLLASLLCDANAAEEQKVLTLHDRLRRIHAAQSGLRDSRDRLLRLQSQTRQ